MGYAMAGLLSGIGDGLQQLGKSIEERRAAALEAARAEASERRKAEQRGLERKEDRANHIEDTATEQANAIARIKTTGEVQGGLQEKRQAHDSTEAALDRGFRAAEANKQRGHEANMATLRSSLDSANDERSIRLKAAIENGQVADSYTTEDGKLAIIYKGGGREITDDPGSRKSTAAPATDPNTGLPVAGTSVAAPPTVPAPKSDDQVRKAYSNFFELIDYANQTNPKAPKGERLRQAIEKADKFGITIPPDQLKKAKEKGWIK